MALETAASPRALRTSIGVPVRGVPMICSLSTFAKLVEVARLLWTAEV